MKKAALLSLGILVVSCTAIKQISKEEILDQKGCEKIDLDSGSLLLRVLIDGNEQYLPIDTGAPFSTLNDTAIIKDFHKKEIGSLGSVTGADRSKKIKKQKFTVQLKSGLFESDNKILTLLSMPQGKCAKSPVKGLIGLDCFFNQDYPLLLNFSDGKICNIDQAEMKNRLAVKGYREVRSQCRSNSIYIYLTLAGKEYKFTFDTGFSGQLIMPFDSRINLDIYNKMELDGSMFLSATATTNGLETYHEKVPVGIAGNKLLAKPIISETVKSRLLGIQFIKGFDWIIDYNHNKVYAKRNHLKIDDTFNRKVSYYAKADQKLTIVIKERNQTKYNLGDEIISVNGQKATAQNNCELQTLLNQTEDWDTLNLEVVSTK
jgi:predicted aspartyl protease